MNTEYRIASDSEDEEDAVDVDDDDQNLKNIKDCDKINNSYELHDIEQLKEQTKELLNPTWKETRNRHLIHKMLELEQPTITVKMVDFLLQEKVCDILVSFITQNGSESSRPLPNDQHGPAMKAVLLLSPENMSDPLFAFLSKKAALVGEIMFYVFDDNSAGSFYHAYRIFECLLRSFPGDLYDGLISDVRMGEKLDKMLAYVGFPPVCELIVMLVALTPLPRSTTIYNNCLAQRHKFLDCITQCNIFLKIVEVLVNSKSKCFCSSYISADQHASAAAQLLQDLVEKLSLEDFGEMCFQPFGQSSACLELLFSHMTSGGEEESVRRECARILAFLLRRASETEIVCFSAGANNGPPTATYVPNRLFPYREYLVNFVKRRVPELVLSLLSFENYVESEERVPTTQEQEGPARSKVIRPFTALRVFLMEVLVLSAESDESVAALISLDLWKRLLAWSLKYSSNNIYHALLYRLIFAVLRQGQEEPQRLLFQKAKFVSYLTDNFLPYGSELVSKLEKGSNAYELRKKRLELRGLLMNCANAVRLQLSFQNSNSFLTVFIASHPKWEDFEKHLLVATDSQMKFGMGIKVSAVDAKGNGARESMNAFASLSVEAKPHGDNLDFNTRFARSLGFYDEDYVSNSFSQVKKDTMALTSLDEGLGIENMEDYCEDGSSSGRLSYLSDESNILDEIKPS